MGEYTSKAQELNTVIEKLYLTPGELECDELCSMLDDIYLTSNGDLNQDFIHEYASVSGKIRELNAVELNGEKVYSFDNLIFNIGCLYDYAAKRDKLYVKYLFMLKDHIGLEVSRINLVEELRWQINNEQKSVKANLDYTKELADSFDAQVRKSKSLLEELQNAVIANNGQIEESKSALNDLEKMSNDMVDKMESVQKDSITILGIFASIVLTFTAGMVFSSSILENIDKASPYRVVGTVLLIAVFITNLVALLLMYIDRVRMIRPSKISYPLCIKVMNSIYVIGFIADFFVWAILEKFSWIYK